jgi:ferredoxin-NADP reductase
VCLYGVRRRQDAVDLDWLSAHCDLRLAVSREEGPPHHHGRVTDLLEALPLNPRVHYYLCGLDAMIDEVSDWLEVRNVDFAHIHRECFFNVAYDAAPSSLSSPAGPGQAGTQAAPPSST